MRRDIKEESVLWVKEGKHKHIKVSGKFIYGEDILSIIAGECQNEDIKKSDIFSDYQDVLNNKLSSFEAGDYKYHIATEKEGKEYYGGDEAAEVGIKMQGMGDMLCFCNLENDDELKIKKEIAEDPKEEELFYDFVNVWGIKKHSTKEIIGAITSNKEDMHLISMYILKKHRSKQLTKDLIEKIKKDGRIKYSRINLEE